MKSVTNVVLGNATGGAARLPLRNVPCGRRCGKEDSKNKDQISKPDINAAGGTARLVIANNGNVEVRCKRFAKRNAVPEKSIHGGLFRFAADVRLSPTQLRFIIIRYQNDYCLRSVSSLTLAGRRSCLYKPIVIAYFNAPDSRALLIQPFFLIIHTDYYQYSRQSLENGWVIKIREAAEAFIDGQIGIF